MARKLDFCENRELSRKYIAWIINGGPGRMTLRYIARQSPREVRIEWSLSR